MFYQWVYWQVYTSYDKNYMDVELTQSWIDYKYSNQILRLSGYYHD